MKKFLIDGFPRNEDNLEGWNKEMRDRAVVKCVLFFECLEEVHHCLPPVIHILQAHIVHNTLYSAHCTMYTV